MVVKYFQKGSKIYFERRYKLTNCKVIIVNNPRNKTERELSSLFFGNSNNMKKLKKLLKKYEATFAKLRPQPILKLKEI